MCFSFLNLYLNLHLKNDNVILSWIHLPTKQTQLCLKKGKLIFKIYRVKLISGLLSVLPQLNYFNPPKIKELRTRQTEILVSFIPLRTDLSPTDLSFWVSPLASLFQLSQCRRCALTLLLMRVKVNTFHGRLRAIWAMITFNIVWFGTWLGSASLF